MATDRLLHADAGSQGYLSSRRREGQDECVWFDAAGQLRGWLPLPRRGHAIAVAPGGKRAVVFGRQPGFFALAFSLDGEGLLPASPLPLPEGHHFYGHGVYSTNGEHLFATENAYGEGRGLIGIYDARPGHGYRRLGELPAGGVGPHDLLALPDGKTLCVAIGGMDTHPDYGKSILNAATMQPGLVYLDIESGEVLEARQLAPEWHRLSLRHLAQDGSGQVWIGAQFASTDGRRPPLVWRHARGGELQALPCDEAALRAMRNYVGSVTTSADGLTVATTSPLGGQVAFWSVETGRLLGQIALHDVCGAAPDGPRGFLLSTGTGVLVRYDPTQPGAEPALLVAAPPTSTGMAWDNHLRRI